MNKSDNCIEKKITVIVPVYNIDKYLENCLQSIILQTLDSVEIICVNDGSTDKSGEILEEWAEKYPEITVIHQKNSGSGPARNRGMKSAKGKYIAFIDPDDYYPHKYALEKLYYAAEKQQVNICGGNVLQNIDEKVSELICGHCCELKQSSCDMEIWYFWRFIYRKSFLDENHIQFPNYRRYQDPPFLVQAMICAKKYYVINDSVYVYRIGHKIVRFPKPVLLDVLNGHKDVLKMLFEEKNETAYYDRFLPTYMCISAEIFRCYKKNVSEAIALIDEINAIIEKWLGNNADGIINEKVISKWEHLRTDLICYTEKHDRIIIYGAGIVGEYVLQWLLGEHIENIEGFAVSKREEKISFVMGYPVRNIADYIYQKEKIGIIVAVSASKWREIVDTLVHNGFFDYFLADYHILKNQV